MVSLGLVFRCLLPPGDSKVLLTHSQRFLNQHRIFALPPGVQPLFDAPADRLGYGDMTGSLQDHRLNVDEPLQVPPSLPHPLQIPPQRPDEPTPDFTTWRVIAP